MYSRTIIVGYVGRDPESRTSRSGKALASFSVATSEKFTDSSGQRQEKTEWHRCICFDRIAEAAKNYVAKGMLILVEGRYETTKWEKDGQQRQRTDLIVQNMKFLKPPPTAQRDLPAGEYADDDLPF